MGIFDKLLKSESSANLNYSPQEAYLGVMLAIAGVDGHLSPEEAQSVNSMLMRNRMFHNVPERQMQQYVSNVTQTLRTSGPGTVISSAANALNQEQKETIFALAVDLVLADGRVDSREKDLLDTIQTAIGVGDDMASMIAQVMLIKNR